jgi:hypothetical protein
MKFIPYLKEKKMKETSQKNRTAMSIIAIVIGLLMIGLIPFLIQTSLGRVLEDITKVVAAGETKFRSGIKLFDLFYPVWRAIIFVAGATLIVVSGAIRKGEEWTFPLAMSMFSLPSIGGFFMFLPYISFVGGFPLPMVISFIGLAGYWAFIFLRKGDKATKWTYFAALTFIGMMATHAFTIGIGAQRQMMVRPNYPFYDDFAMWLFLWTGEVNWVATILLVISIPFLAIGKERGWWLAVIGASAILVLDAFTLIFRHSTLDFLYGALLAGGVLFFTVLPYFKNHLLGSASEPREV